MKDLLLNVLKYFLLIVVLIVLMGYLSLKGNLPAVVPEGLAVQMKNFSKETIGFFSGKKNVPIVNKNSAGPVSLPEVSAFYSMGDRLFMDGRFHEVQEYSRINEKRVADFLLESEKFLSDLADSQVFKNFLASQADDKKFELKFYIEKYLKEDASIAGFELYDLQNQPMVQLFKIPLETKMPKKLDGSIFMTSFNQNGESYISIFKRVAVEGKQRAIIHIIYNPQIFKFCMLTEKFNSSLVILDTDNSPVFYQSKDLNRNAISMIRFAIVKAGYAVKASYEGLQYRVIYSPFGGDLKAVYFYTPVTAAKIGLNVFLYLFVIFLIVILILVALTIYRNVYLKHRAEKIRKEEVITGTVSEMIKTLKSTADLTAKMAESSKEDIAMIRQTIEKITDTEENSFRDRRPTRDIGSLED